MNSILRLEAMDAQRFDLSKRRKNPSNLAISTPASNVDLEEESGIPQITVISPGGSPSNETSTVTESSSGTATDDSTSSSTTVVEAAVFTHKNDAQSSDVFERDGYTTTRTIIRPASPRSPLLSIFSRPSSPLPSLTSRPSSPLGTRLANLNCMGSTDAFEEELDFILKQRANDLAGVSQQIKVQVIQDHAVFYEEKWRDAVQALLYDNTPPPVSCVGHVHAY